MSFFSVGIRNTQGPNARVLFLSVPTLSAVHFLFGPRDWAGDAYLLWTPVEAALFTGFVLWAHWPRSLARSFAAVLSASVANFLVNLYGVFIPVSVGALLDFSYRADLVFSWTFLAAFGALIYCAIVHVIVRPSYFNVRTYILVVCLCAISGVPLMELLPPSAGLLMHKAMWWFLFSLALTISSAVIRPSAHGRALESS